MSDSPTERYTRPKPRPHARPRPSLFRYVLVTVLVAGVAAIALLGGLSVQVSSGNDRVLGTTTTEQQPGQTPAIAVGTPPATSATPATAVTQAPTPVQTSTS
jgi:hypothetical protein